MDNATILGHSLTEWEPMPPQEGPPLPSFLGIYWPWYKVPAGKVTITINIQGQGTVSPTTGIYDLGAKVTFTATPASGSTFQGWGYVSGGQALAPTSNPLTLTVTQDMTITASFSTPTPPPTGGAAVFTIAVANLPAEATSWGCAFQDPATGIYSEPTNHPTTGLFTFGASEIAQISVPVSAGVLSISAFAEGGSSTEAGIMLPAQIVNYQINISVSDGGAYTFDFNTQKLS